MCFDWDFVPQWILDNIDWSDPYGPAIASGRDDSSTSADHGQS
ncbi:MULTISPECIES: hypothetical protein [unclassified Sphingobium]|nr:MULTISPECIES: hypothetical protein [unclassified Sphingobium]